MEYFFNVRNSVFEKQNVFYDRLLIFSQCGKCNRPSDDPSKSPLRIYEPIFISIKPILSIIYTSHNSIVYLFWRILFFVLIRKSKYMPGQFSYEYIQKGDEADSGLCLVGHGQGPDVYPQREFLFYDGSGHMCNKGPFISLYRI